MKIINFSKQSWHVARRQQQSVELSVCLFSLGYIVSMNTSTINGISLVQEEWRQMRSRMTKC